VFTLSLYPHISLFPLESRIPGVHITKSTTVRFLQYEKSEAVGILMGPTSTAAGYAAARRRAIEPLGEPGTMVRKRGLWGRHQRATPTSTLRLARNLMDPASEVLFLFIFGSDSLNRGRESRPRWQVTSYLYFIRIGTLIIHQDRVTALPF
jgi:hypothetical protein